MFKKLVSNLPFQPSLLGEVTFYIGRLKKEQTIRRLGLVLVLVGFGLQVFTVMFPPQSTLATHRSDIIYGASSRSDVLNAYRRNEDQLGRKDIQAIFNNYGIGEAQIQNAKTVTISDGDSNFINTSRNISVEGRKFVPISGAIDGGIYEFPLTYWRKNEYPNGYPALTGLSSYGFRFWILLKGCGNIVYEKGAKKPRLEIVKNRTTGSESKVGSQVEYEIKFRNSGAISSKNTKITDTLPRGLEYSSYSSNLDLKFNNNGNDLSWSIANKDSVLGAGSKWYYIKLITKATTVSSNLCNIAAIDAGNSPKVSSKEGASCIKVLANNCPGTSLPIPPGGLSACQTQCIDGSTINYTQSCPKPNLSCQEIKVVNSGTWNTRTLNIATLKQPGATISQVDYYVNNELVKSLPGNANDNYSYEHVFAQEGQFSVQAKLVSTSSNVQDSASCNVVENITKPEVKEVIITTDKKVSNITQNIDDANNTTANAGDVLKYSLFIENKGNDTAPNFELNGEYAEDVSDILEYADITNLQDGVLNKDTGKISWTTTTINPGQTLTKEFEVKIKNPIPNTPTSASNPLSYDYEITNIYGRTVKVKLNKTATKRIEQAASTLPNTGPNITTTLSLLIVIIAGYFYYRNRIITKELVIIHKDFASGGY